MVGNRFQLIQWVLQLMHCLLLPIVIFRCRQTASPTQTESVEEDLPIDLNQDVFRSQRYIFQLADRPTENWQIEMATNADTVDAFLNWESIFGGKIKFNDVNSMLLLQPKFLIRRLPIFLSGWKNRPSVC